MSHELHGDAAERAEVGMQGVALLGEHHAGERAGEHQVARLQRDAVRAELVGEPGDTQRRMAEHTGGHTGLLDLGVAVHDAADPAQVDLHGSDRPRSEEHTSELQSLRHLVCRLLLEKKNKQKRTTAAKTYRPTWPQGRRWRSTEQ